jgi:DNA-directed RNA polymerase specialized sigma24 family protein
MKSARTEQALVIMMQTSGLIEAAKRKDIQAYNHLISEYQDLLYSFAYYVFYDEHSAQSVCEQAFLQAFLKLNKHKGEDLRFWLLKNLIQVCQGKIKHGREKSIPSEQPGRAENPFLSLPLELRIPLLLVEFEGMNYQQTAVLTGASPGKVAVQLCQARQRLT